MIKASIAFFILAIISLLLGLGGVAGLSMDIAKILIAVFLVLAVLGFFVRILGGKQSHLP